MNLLPSARCETLRTETTGVTSVAASAASRPKVTAKRLINPSYVKELRKRNTQKAEFVIGKKKPNQISHSIPASRAAHLDSHQQPQPSFPANAAHSSKQTTLRNYSSVGTVKSEIRGGRISKQDGFDVVFC